MFSEPPLNTSLRMDAQILGSTPFGVSGATGEAFAVACRLASGFSVPGRERSSACAAVSRASAPMASMTALRTAPLPLINNLTEQYLELDSLVAADISQ